MKVLNLKLLLTIAFFCLCHNLAFSQAQIVFNEETHDFGQIKQGSWLSYAFEIKNNGNTPLLIHKVEATCGCILSSFTQKPILPAETGYVWLSFNTDDKLGSFIKSATVINNSTESIKIIYIKGEVFSHKENSLFSNTSRSFSQQVLKEGSSFNFSDQLFLQKDKTIVSEY